MSGLPPDDPRLNPLPDELDGPNDDVLTTTAGDVFHRIDHGDVPVCRNGGSLSRHPRNTLPRRVPCAVCFPSVYGNDSDDELTTTQERIDRYQQ